MKTVNNIMIFMIGMVLIGVIFESAIFLVGYYNADEVECNWLWCSFKTTKRTIDDNTIVTSTSIINNECYRNGIKVNCSDINNIYMNYTKPNIILQNEI